MADKKNDADPYAKYVQSGADPYAKYVLPQAGTTTTTGNSARTGDVATPSRASLTTANHVEPVTRLEKLTHGLVDPLDGLVQLTYNMLPDGAQDALTQTNNWISDKFDNPWWMTRIPEKGLNSVLLEDATGKPQSGMDAFMRKKEEAYQAARAAAGESGFDGWRLTGNVASPVNLAVAARLPAAASLAGRTAVGLLGGGLSGAMQPVTDAPTGHFWSEKAMQTGLSSLFGGALPLAFAGVGRWISPKASTNPEAANLIKEKIPTTIGQTLGGWVNGLERAVQANSIIGKSIQNARQRGTQEFADFPVKHAMESAGIPLSEIPAIHTGEKALDYAKMVLEEHQKDLVAKMSAFFKGNEQIFSQKLKDVTQGKAIIDVGKAASKHVAAHNNVLNPDSMQRVLKDVPDFARNFPDVHRRMKDLADAAIKIFGRDIADRPGWTGKLADSSVVNDKLSGIPGLSHIVGGLYSASAQNIIRFLATKRPVSAPAAAEALTQSAPLFSPAAGLLGVQYMSQDDPPRKK